MKKNLSNRLNKHKVKIHMFNGRKYHIDMEPYSGWCDTSKVADYLYMRFPDGIVKDFDSLDTVVHEALHACFPRMSEKIVTKTATSIAKFLWRLNYRKID
jgi:hypothetical protein